MKQPFEVLHEAIPRGQRDRLGRLLGHKNGDVVRKWCREAESDDAPTASGRESALDRMCHLLDLVFVVNPAGPAILAAYISEYVAELQRAHHHSDFDERRTASCLVDRTAEAVRTLLDGEFNDADIEAMLKVRLYLDERIEAARAARKKTVRIDAGGRR